MKNLSKNQLCETNAGGSKDIYSTIWSGIASFAGGDNKAAKSSAMEQFENLEKGYKTAKGYYNTIVSFFK